MAITPITTGLGSLSNRAISGSGSKSFLGYSAKSPVQQLLEAQKAEKAKLTPYMESEDFLRMKAFEISNRIRLMNRLGQSEAVAALEAEGQQVVAKYMALMQQQKAEEAASSIEEQVASQLGLDTSA